MFALPRGRANIDRVVQEVAHGNENRTFHIAQGD